MKKIGILTFQESYNFGAVLQAYALQTKLKELNYKVEIINYHSKYKEKMYSGKYDKNKSLLSNINTIISFPLQNGRKKKVNDFKKRNLNITSSVFESYEQLKEYSKKFDYIICGSDQVWNYNNTGYDERYLLDFVESEDKKVAYAASMGVSDIGPKEVDFYYNNLINFQKISVRERTASKLLKNIIKRDVPVVLDPCLLLESKDWEKLIVKNNKINYNYIFVYYVHYSKELISYAKKLSKETKLPVIISSRTIRELKDGFKNRNLSVEDFITTVKNAQYVITNSFHGTVFSIIFNKKFIVFTNNRNKANTNSRLLDLLNTLNLEDRIYKKNKNTIYKTWNKYIVIKKLNKLRNESIKFIKDSLK